MTFTGTGSATGTVPIAVSLAAPISQSFTGTVQLSDNNLFDGLAPTIQLTGLNGWERFTSVDGSGLSSALTDLSSALANIGAASGLNKSVTLTTDKLLGEIFDFKAGLDQTVVDKVLGSNGQPARTLQSFLSSLGSSLTGGNFNASTGELSLSLDFSQQLAAQSVALSFDTSLGDLASITTESVGTLQASVGGKFTIGIDLRPVGSRSVLNSGTSVLALNGPDGTVVPLDPSGKPMWYQADRRVDDNPLAIKDGALFKLSDGTEFEVYFDGVTTLGAAMAAIELAGQARPNWKLVATEAASN